MKPFLLLLLFTAATTVHAQQKVNTLPPGTYAVATKFAFGNIVLLDDTHYTVGNDTTVGDYKFSATAQRVLFLSGPLKGVFARSATRGDGTAILLPAKENKDLGLKLIEADLWAVHKQ